MAQCADVGGGVGGSSMESEGLCLSWEGGLPSQETTPPAAQLTLGWVSSTGDSLCRSQGAS